MHRRAKNFYLPIYAFKLSFSFCTLHAHFLGSASNTHLSFWGDYKEANFYFSTLEGRGGGGCHTICDLCMHITNERD